MDLLRIAARIAGNSTPTVVSGGVKTHTASAKSIYIDWEGSGYTLEDLEADLEVLKAAFGEGPIWSGTSEELPGQFFSSAPELGPLQAYRAGHSIDAKYAEGSDVQWGKFENFEELETEYRSHME